MNEKSNYNVSSMCYNESARGTLFMTTLTIRTDEKLKEEAKEVFESMGLNISTAINVFLKQAVLQKRFPIGIEAEKPSDYRHTYPKDFFNFFGSGKDDNLEVPEDMALKPEEMDL